MKILIVIFVIAVFLIIIFTTSNTNDNKKSQTKINEIRNVDGDVPNYIKSHYKLGSQKQDIQVPDPRKTSNKEMLDFIERTDSFYLDGLLEELNKPGVFNHPVLKKAIHDKALFDKFDRPYYDSMLVEKLENNGFKYDGTKFEYHFSFPIDYKNKDSISKIIEDGYISRNVGVVNKKDVFNVKLGNAIIGTVPDLFIEKIKEVYENQIYCIIEQMPSPEKDCIISVNVSKRPRPLARNPLDKIYEVQGVFIKDRKEHILDECCEGNIIFFEDEFSNEFDDEAIKVICNKKLIGYVSKQDQPKINKLIAKSLIAKIHRINVRNNYLSVYYKFFEK